MLKTVLLRAAIIGGCAFSGVAAPSGAELVVLVGGYVLKAETYDVAGDRITIVLPSEGQLTLPLLRVERIVEDEIVVGGDLDVAPFAIGFAADSRVPETPFGELIFAAAERHEINPDLVAAMVRWESAFDPRAVSPKGASGLMQLMPATALRFGVTESGIFEPRDNLDAGVRYLSWLAGRFDRDLPLMLAAYNAGEATVDRYDGVPPFRETRDYIRRIYGTLGLEAESTLDR